MTLEERDQRMREEGLKEGIEKGMKEGIEKGREQGKEEGREEGREEGWNSLAKLISFLMEKGLIEEAQKAAGDKEYAVTLMEKYRSMI